MKEEKFLVNFSWLSTRDNLHQIHELYENKIHEEFKRFKTKFNLSVFGIKNSDDIVKFHISEHLQESDFIKLFEYIKIKDKLEYEYKILSNAVRPMINSGPLIKLIYGLVSWSRRYKKLNDYKFDLNIDKLHFSKKSIKKDSENIKKIIDNKIQVIDKELKRFHYFYECDITLLFNDNKKIIGLRSDGSNKRWNIYYLYNGYSGEVKKRLEYINNHEKDIHSLEIRITPNIIREYYKLFLEKEYLNEYRKNL